jgi:hypothetical protein
MKIPTCNLDFADSALSPSILIHQWFASACMQQIAPASKRVNRRTPINTTFHYREGCVPEILVLMYIYLTIDDYFELVHLPHHAWHLKA